MFIPGKNWWLEEIENGFVLIHSNHGRDVAARIDWDRESAPELREKLAAMIVELHELIQQPAIWIKT